MRRQIHRVQVARHLEERKKIIQVIAGNEKVIAEFESDPLETNDPKPEAGQLEINIKNAPQGVGL